MQLKYIIIFFTALLFALVVTWATREIARRLGIGEQPDARKVHKTFMPHMGGFGIFGGFGAGLAAGIILLPDFPDLLLSRYGGLLLASLIIVALGAYDDLKGLDATKKFAGQFIAVTVLIAFGFKIQTIDIPFGSPIHLGWLAVPLTYLWLVGVSNAVNLLDGLDGLAAGVSTIVMLVILTVALQTNNSGLVVISLSLLAGMLGFLRFNYHPATIFMGDTGSLFLGLILAALSIKAFQFQTTRVPLHIAAILLAIPIGDTSVAFFRRLNKGRHPFKPDKDHLHHRLIQLGLSHRQAVHIIYLAAGLYAAVAYLIATQVQFLGLLLFILIVLLSFFGLQRIGYLESQRVRSYYGDETIIEVKSEVAPLNIRRLLHKLLLGWSDVLTINLALFLTWYIRFKINLIPANKQVMVDQLLIFPVIFLLTLFWVGLFLMNNLYNMRWDVSRFDQVRRLARVVVFGILIFFVVTFDPNDVFSEGRLTLLIYGLLLLVFVIVGRMLIVFIEKRWSLLEYAPHKTLMVGDTEKGRKLLKDITHNPHLLYHLIGYVSKQPKDRQFYGLNNLGTYDDIGRIVREYGVEEVIIAINERSRDEILNIVAQAENLNVVFKILPQIYDLVSGHKTEEVIGHPLIRLFPEQMYLWQWGLKRLMDILLSLGLMLVLSPLLLLIVMLQMLSGIHPPFIIINTVGKFGRVYGMLNFNTGFKGGRRPMIGEILYATRMYKLPALLNILLGKMSFVGPRPETPQLVRHLQEKIKFYNRRFQIRPGLTGWAQVKYRYEEALKHKREQFKQDLFYLENMSLTFDIRILLRSLIIFLVRRE